MFAFALKPPCLLTRHTHRTCVCSVWLMAASTAERFLTLTEELATSIAHARHMQMYPNDGQRNFSNEPMRPKHTTLVKKVFIHTNGRGKGGRSQKGKGKGGKGKVGKGKGGHGNNGVHSRGHNSGGDSGKGKQGKGKEDGWREGKRQRQRNRRKRWAADNAIGYGSQWMPSPPPPAVHREDAAAARRGGEHSRDDKTDSGKEDFRDARSHSRGGCRRSRSQSDRSYSQRHRR